MQDVNDIKDKDSSPLSPIHKAELDGTMVFPTKKGYFGKFVLLVFVTSCAVILFTSIISRVRQDRFHMLESKRLLEKQAAWLEEENSRLEKEYSGLQNDPVRIEKEARERLGFAKPDEVFYKKYNFRIKRATNKEPTKTISQNRWKAFLFEGPFPWQFPAFIILIASAYYLISYHYEYRKLHRSDR